VGRRADAHNGPHGGLGREREGGGDNRARDVARCLQKDVGDGGGSKQQTVQSAEIGREPEDLDEKLGREPFEA
jgi:hypothetical protein